MRKRELLAGFGAGLMVAAAVLGAVHHAAPASSASLTKEQVKQAAEALQMVVLSKAEYDRLRQEQKVSLPPAPTPPKQPQAPAVVTPSQPKTQTPLPPEVDRNPETAAAPQPPSAAVPAAGSEPSKTDGNSRIPGPAAPQPPAATVTVQVPYKATAEGVARKLVEAGVLGADNTLVETLRAQNKLNRIRVGTYQIPTGASETDIVRIITTPPAK
jgi:outer membrane biosynthesis protein TonB